MSRLLTCLILFLALAPVFAQEPGVGFNEYTIRREHLTANVPQFADYPASSYAGKNAAVRWRDNAFTRMYQSNLREFGMMKPNFAGNYIFATWSCGTNCTSIAIIDAMTGKVTVPEGVSFNAAVNVHDNLQDEGMLRFRADSRLLVLIGMPEDDTRRRGISYYVWEPPKLKLLHHVPVAWYPDKQESQ